ncbi:hypothetical protein Q3G72_023487 [Acer saccharum]|nr:hypothetical protein Q3G72_023487 [Acer saccharum]
MTCLNTEADPRIPAAGRPQVTPAGRAGLDVPRPPLPETRVPAARFPASRRRGFLVSVCADARDPVGRGEVLGPRVHVGVGGSREEHELRDVDRTGGPVGAHRTEAEGCGRRRREGRRGSASAQRSVNGGAQRVGGSGAHTDPADDRHAAGNGVRCGRPRSGCADGLNGKTLCAVGGEDVEAGVDLRRPVRQGRRAEEARRSDICDPEDDQGREVLRGVRCGRNDLLTVGEGQEGLSIDGGARDRRPGSAGGDDAVGAGRRLVLHGGDVGAGHRDLVTAQPERRLRRDGRRSRGASVGLSRGGSGGLGAGDRAVADTVHGLDGVVVSRAAGNGGVNVTYRRSVRGGVKRRTGSVHCRRRRPPHLVGGERGPAVVTRSRPRQGDLPSASRCDEGLYGSRRGEGEQRVGRNVPPATAVRRYGAHTTSQRGVGVGRHVVRCGRERGNVCQDGEPGRADRAAVVLAVGGQRRRLAQGLDLQDARTGNGGDVVSGKAKPGAVDVGGGGELSDRPRGQGAGVVVHGEDAEGSAVTGGVNEAATVSRNREAAVLDTQRADLRAVDADGAAARNEVDGILARRQVEVGIPDGEIFNHRAVSDAHILHPGQDDVSRASDVEDRHAGLVGRGHRVDKNVVDLAEGVHGFRGLLVCGTDNNGRASVIVGAMGAGHVSHRTAVDREPDGGARGAAGKQLHAVRTSARGGLDVLDNEAVNVAQVSVRVGGGEALVADDSHRVIAGGAVDVSDDEVGRLAHDVDAVGARVEADVLGLPVGAGVEVEGVLAAALTVGGLHEKQTVACGDSDPVDVAQVDGDGGQVVLLAGRAQQELRTEFPGNGDVTVAAVDTHPGVSDAGCGRPREDDGRGVGDAGDGRLVGRAARVGGPRTGDDDGLADVGGGEGPRGNGQGRRPRSRGAAAGVGGRVGRRVPDDGRLQGTSARQNHGHTQPEFDAGSHYQRGVHGVRGGAIGGCTSALKVDDAATGSIRGVDGRLNSRRVVCDAVAKGAESNGVEPSREGVSRRGGGRGLARNGGRRGVGGVGGGGSRGAHVGESAGGRVAGEVDLFKVVGVEQRGAVGEVGRRRRNPGQEQAEGGVRGVVLGGVVAVAGLDVGGEGDRRGDGLGHGVRDRGARVIAGVGHGVKRAERPATGGGPFEVELDGDQGLVGALTAVHGDRSGLEDLAEDPEFESVLGDEQEHPANLGAGLRGLVGNSPAGERGCRAAVEGESEVSDGVLGHGERHGARAAGRARGQCVERLGDLDVLTRKVVRETRALGGVPDGRPGRGGFSADGYQSRRERGAQGRGVEAARAEGEIRWGAHGHSFPGGRVGGRPPSRERACGSERGVGGDVRGALVGQLHGGAAGRPQVVHDVARLGGVELGLVRQVVGVVLQPVHNDAREVRVVATVVVRAGRVAAPLVEGEQLPVRLGEREEVADAGRGEPHGLGVDAAGRRGEGVVGVHADDVDVVVARVERLQGALGRRRGRDGPGDRDAVARALPDLGHGLAEPGDEAGARSSVGVHADVRVPARTVGVYAVELPGQTENDLGRSAGALLRDGLADSDVLGVVGARGRVGPGPAAGERRHAEDGRGLGVEPVEDLHPAKVVPGRRALGEVAVVVLEGVSDVKGATASGLDLVLDALRQPAGRVAGWRVRVCGNAGVGGLERLAGRRGRRVAHAEDGLADARRRGAGHAQGPGGADRGRAGRAGGDVQVGAVGLAPLQFETEVGRAREALGLDGRGVGRARDDRVRVVDVVHARVAGRAGPDGHDRDIGLQRDAGAVGDYDVGKVGHLVVDSFTAEIPHGVPRGSWPSPVGEGLP